MRYHALSSFVVALLLGTAPLPGCGSDSSGTKLDTDPADTGDGEGSPSDDGDPGSDGSSGDGSPGDGNPGDGSPGDGNPGDGNPGDGNPGDGNPGDGSDGDDGAPASYYRADSFVQVAPRAWGKFPLTNAPIDVTDQVNDEVAKTLVEDNGPDSTPDGILDLNMFVRFADPSASSGDAAVGGGQCTAPLDDSACTPDSAWDFTEVTYGSQADGVCLASAGEQVPAPCFVTAATDVVVTLGAFRNLPLKDFQLAGQLTSEGRIDAGLLRGFLTEADAMTAKLPDDLPPAAAGLGIVAGAPLTSVLHTDEQETRNDVKGWWITAKVTAALRAFTP